MTNATISEAICRLALEFAPSVLEEPHEIGVSAPPRLLETIGANPAVAGSCVTLMQKS